MQYKFEPLPLAAVRPPPDTKSGIISTPRELHYKKNAELKQLIEAQWEKELEIENATRRKVKYGFFRHFGKKAGEPIKDFRGAFSSALKKAQVEFYEYVKDGKWYASGGTFTISGGPQSATFAVPEFQRAPSC